MKKLHPDSDFNFWMPAEIEKAKDKTGKEVMRIKGIASTIDEDSEGEVLEPMGFDLDRFLKIGFINWNHQAKNDPSKVIGEPDVAKIIDGGKKLYVEGNLYNDHPLAVSTYKLAETLSKNNSKRRLGFSIEGKAIERDPMNPKRITKAMITGLAVTPTPVNQNTLVDLVKGTQKEDLVEYEFNDDIEFTEIKKGEFIYEFNVGDNLYGITKSFDCVEIEKAIIPDIEKEETESQKKIKKVMTEFKNGTLKDSHGNKVTDRDQALAIAMSEAGMSKEKSMDTVSTAPLIPESLEKKPKVLTSPVIKKAIKDGIVPLKTLIRSS